MKMKNILFFTVSMVVVQSAFAARLTVYNESGNDVSVTVYYGKENLSRSVSIPVKTNNKDSKYVFDSGLHAFSKLHWTDSGKAYEYLIPSTRVMLGGTIVLRKDGNMAINFDERGASPSKLWEVVASEVSRAR